MRAVICGGGIAGLTLAQRLDQHGWQVVVLEQAPAPRGTGYMIDFFGPGYDAAEALAVLPRLHELGYRVQEMSYRDATGRRRAGLSLDRFANLVDGRLVSIMRPDLERALRERVSSRVDLRYATSLTAIDNRDDGVRVTLTDGSTLDADLLVGADGIHSAVRALTFGDESRFLRYLGFHTAAFVVDVPELHALVRDQFCLTDTVDRQLGCYGLRDGRVAVFTVHRTADPGLPADPRAAVRAEYARLGWIVPRVLRACPPAGQIYYDQVAQVEVPSWSRGRVVLVGDACQAVSLLAGQGASLGVAGGYLLAEELARVDPGSSGTDSVGAALARYEATMRPVVTEKQRVARAGTRWFLPERRWQLSARRVALRLARLPGVDRIVAGALIGELTKIKPSRSLPASPG
ncbi:FAD-dependent monooxygenase [Solwaraspora sp. WMMD1047]|uniref:FAD-dependent oxidoreductase n=1 Tax=Solwaraspora sp. WMMD1047 TaxID=3016102 RepID=UPI002415C915|nr:FAD-dependent oxidoreductase [Solwaraspora sp. WMMD1047]MDG4831631.1 FAD-dependent monooxygenase [Solwaraspora sp. WMMD1047]